MKKFITDIFVFSLLILVPLVVSELYVRSLPNASRYKHTYMQSHSTETETLVLGNSHTYYGIDPSMLGSHAFSLAMPSQTYRYDYYLLTHYDMPRLKTVVLSVTYTSMFEDLDTNDKLRCWAVRYRLYMDCDLHSSLSQYGFEFLYVPSFKEKLASLWRKPLERWDSLGFGTSYGHRSLIAEGRDNGEARARENTDASDTSATVSREMLHKICEWCGERGVRLVLVVTPTVKSFREACDPGRRKAIKEALRCVLSRYPWVEFYDFEADDRFVKSDFYDADHLNLLGAHKLTLLLKEAMSIEK